MHGKLNVPGKPIKEVIHNGKKLPEFEDYFRLRNKVKRVYEDEDFIVDLVKNEDGTPMLRISIFDEKGHFLDEEFVRKKDYLD